MESYKFSLFKYEHIGNRVAALNSPAVASGMMIEIPVSAWKTEKWFHDISGSDNRRDFSLAIDGSAIGFSGIVDINRKDSTAELYIFILDSYQNKGAGAVLLECMLGYAKSELNLRKILLFVSDGNDGACRFYERHGFNREATLKNQAYHRGRYVDRHIYSIFLERHKPSVNFYDLID